MIVGDAMIEANFGSLLKLPSLIVYKKPITKDHIHFCFFEIFEKKKGKYFATLNYEK